NYVGFKGDDGLYDRRVTGGGRTSARRDFDRRSVGSLGNGGRSSCGRRERRTRRALRSFEIAFSETTWRRIATNPEPAQAVESEQPAPSTRQNRECVA